jgi:predicted MFS family arabinose efflux permease
MFVNPIACALVLVAVHRLIAADRRRGALVNFDARGALLATGGMLLLVYSLVEAPNVGWGTVRTIAGIGGALAVLGAFFLNERLVKAPLAPLSIFRINGLAFADITLMVSAAGLIAMFFFITLYMQGVLGFSPIQTGAAYLPFCAAFIVSAGASSALIPRLGTRAMMVGGAAIGAAGMFWLSRISVGDSFAGDVLPGLLIIAIGFGPAFVGVTTAGNAGVPPDKAGLAASLLNASQQLGAALGLAVLTALATEHTNSLLQSGSSSAQALTGGLRLALLVGSMLIAASALVALRATDTRGEGIEERPEAGGQRRQASEHGAMRARRAARPRRGERASA